jgi:hypothetical protein
LAASRERKSFAALREERLDDPSERERFWHAARAKLGKLHRIAPRDRWLTEIELRKKVPMLMPQAKSEVYNPATVRPSASSVTGPHQPLQQTLRSR